MLWYAHVRHYYAVNKYTEERKTEINKQKRDNHALVAVHSHFNSIELLVELIFYHESKRKSTFTKSKTFKESEVENSNKNRINNITKTIVQSQINKCFLEHS